ncbi:MAG: hypothetical protein WCO06_00990 [Candidatus Roizmanbacteria bacterium]
MIHIQSVNNGFDTSFFMNEEDFVMCTNTVDAYSQLLGKEVPQDIDEMPKTVWIPHYVYGDMFVEYENAERDMHERSQYIHFKPDPEKPEFIKGKVQKGNGGARKYMSVLEQSLRSFGIFEKHLAGWHTHLPLPGPIISYADVWSFLIFKSDAFIHLIPNKDVVIGVFETKSVNRLKVRIENIQNELSQAYWYLAKDTIKGVDELNSIFNTRGLILYISPISLINQNKGVLLHQFGYSDHYLTQLQGRGM